LIRSYSPKEEGDKKKERKVERRIIGTSLDDKSARWARAGLVFLVLGGIGGGV